MKRIYLDIDDTLNTLSLDLLRFDGLDFNSYEEVGEWPWGYDIIGAIAELKGEPRMELVEYWQRLPRELWAESTLAPDFDAILGFCDDKVGLDNVIVATSPTKCPESLAGKLEWMMEHLPKELHRQYSITPRKWSLGHDTGGVLIDDVQDNCVNFVTPVDGEPRGKAILVPRPWNFQRTMPIMECIQEQWEILLDKETQWT